MEAPRIKEFFKALPLADTERAARILEMTHPEFTQHVKGIVESGIMSKDDKIVVRAYGRLLMNGFSTVKGKKRYRREARAAGMTIYSLCHDAASGNPHARKFLLMTIEELQAAEWEVENE